MSRRRTTAQLDFPISGQLRDRDREVRPIGTTSILWADDSGRRVAAFEHQHRHCTVVRRVTPNGYECRRCASCRSEVWSRAGVDPGVAT